METKASEEPTVDTDVSKEEDAAVGKDGKVQLDIEDAPFLSEAKEEAVNKEKEILEESSTQSNTDSLEAKPEEVPQKSNKKNIIFAISALLVVIILAVSIWFFFFYSSGASEESVTESPTIIVVPSVKDVKGPKEYKIIFAPFMVEEQSPTLVSFLQATFTGISKDEKVIREAQGKELVLRDAIYYYLRNKKHSFLIDPGSTMEIKRDLLDIVNGYLSSGKMEDILLENYILK